MKNKIYIEKVKYDKEYPYRLTDGYYGILSLTLDDLQEIQKEIKKILDNENKKWYNINTKEREIMKWIMKKILLFQRQF